MVTQNTTTAAGAAPTGARIRLNTPQANQQVVIDNIAGATLEMGFPSEAAQLEQSGQDLVFLFENGGRIVLSNFFGLFESNQLPAFNLEDGQSLPGDAFLAALREDLLPAAGPGAGAAAGSGGVGDYDDNAGDLIGGVDRLDPLGTTGIGTAALQGIEDEGPLDLATGSLLITINTNISTTIEQNGEYPEHPDAVPPGAYAGVFEDWAPNQHLGSPLTFEAVLGFIFTPTDNEVLDSITITGPIAGTLLVGGVPVAADGAGNFVISAADIDDVTLLPLADSGTDIPLSGFASITDPDSGLSGTVPFTFTAVVDAVADQPTGVHETVSYGPFYCDHGNGDYGNGDGEVVTARVMDSEGDERSFWHHNPHDAPNGPWWKNTAADPTETEDGDHTQSAVKITLSATFGDYQDGSEQHYLIIEAKAGWTYATVNIDGVEVDLAQYLRSAADVPVTGAQADALTAEAYYVIPVGEESIVYETTVGGREVATKAVTLTLYPPDEDYVPGGNGGYEGNGEYEGPVIATVDQGYNGEGQHCERGNDYKETFVTGALAVDNDADGSLTTVNDTSLALGSADVWVAAAEGHIYVTGQQIGYEDPKAFAHDPPSYYDPFSTKDIDLDFHFSGADDEHLDYLRIAVDPETPAKVLIFGHEALLMHDDEGDYYVVPAYLKDHVTLMPAKDSDVDVNLTVTAVFHDPDSGDIGTDTTQHTVVIDAVADKPTGVTVDVNDSGDDGATFKFGETGSVRVTANFADTDGSEDHKVVLEIPDGFTVNEAQINASGGTWNGTARTVTWDIDNGGNLDKTISVTNSSAGSGSHNFKVTAHADEMSPVSPAEPVGTNNHAETSATDQAVVNNGDSVGWYIRDAAEYSNVVYEGDSPSTGPWMAFTVGYSGYTLQPGESISIVLTGPAEDSSADENDFNNSANNFAARLNAATNGVNDGVDYDPATNTLRFFHDGVTPPPTALSFYAEVKGDKFVEPDEVIKFVLSDPKYNGQPGGNIVEGIEDGTIKNDDQPFTGGDTLGITLQDAQAVGGAQDTDGGTLDFAEGGAGTVYSFDISGAGHAPSVSGLGGTGIIWSGDGTGTLVGKIDGVTAITLQLSDDNAGHVQVTATLADPLKHANGLTDVVVSNVHVKAVDGGNTAYGTVTVNVDDASPTANPDVKDYTGGMTTNLVIMMDRSGSMDSDSGIDKPGPGNYSRWEVALEGMKELIDAYADLGSVNVKIVDFYDGEASSSSWYYDAASGTVTYLISKDPDGGTSYDAATDRVMVDLANGMPPADKSVVYFLSDGNPDPDSDGLDAGEVAAWETFLDGTPIDAVYSFGIGTSVDTGPLGTVAWSADGSADKIVVVDDLNDFTQALLATVPTQGSLVVDAGADGWPAGAKLASVNYNNGDGNTGDDNYVIGVNGDNGTWDGHVLVLTLANNQGTLKIDFDDGTYVYIPGSNPNGNAVIGYTIVDADGTQASSTLTLNLTAGDLIANNNTESLGSVVVDDFTSGNDEWTLNSGAALSNGAVRMEVSNNDTDSMTKDYNAVAAGTTMAFRWTFDRSSGRDTGDDKLRLVVRQGSNVVDNLIINSAADNLNAGGVFFYTFAAAGNYTVEIVAEDTDWSWNNRDFTVTIDDVTSHVLDGNVVTDHTVTDVQDVLHGHSAFITEVNGHAVGSDGYTAIGGEHGDLYINNYGEYHYVPHEGHTGDDVFAYKLASSSDSDYALLTIHAGSGSAAAHVEVMGTSAAETLNGTDANEVIMGLAGNDTLNGLGGHDILIGGEGNDILNGGAGNDVLYGGHGNDTLNGGANSDTFVWNTDDFTAGARDVVSDFNINQDVLRFADVLLDSNSGSNGIQMEIGKINYEGSGQANDVQITLHHGGAEQTVVLQNVLSGSSSNMDNQLQAIEQHILTNKIITENS